MHASSNQIPPRRGAVAVVMVEKKFLVIRRSQSVVAPGKFCFPGGSIEPGEGEAEAIVREFREELNALVTPVGRVWQSTTAWGVELAWWLGRLAPGAALVPNPAEVESFHWLSADEMNAEAMLLESNRLFLRAVAAGEIQLEDNAPAR